MRASEMRLDAEVGATSACKDRCFLAQVDATDVTNKVP